MADELGLHTEQVTRWCRKWFGPLPPERRKRNRGYRIPKEYFLVARCWNVCQDERVRRVAQEALIEAPAPYLVVVANEGTTHYTWDQVVARVGGIGVTYGAKDEVAVNIFKVGAVPSLNTDSKDTHSNG